jgi:hypothetical protein
MNEFRVSLFQKQGRKVVSGGEVVENDMFYERQVNMERIRDLEMKTIAQSATIEQLKRQIVEYRMKASFSGTNGFDTGLGELLEG